MRHDDPERIYEEIQPLALILAVAALLILASLLVGLGWAVVRLILLLWCPA